MTIAAPTLIQADQEISQIITCSTTDRLVEQVPVSVIFFYKEKLSPEPLMAALRKVLADFPMFSGRLKIESNNLLIDCNNSGVQFTLCFNKCSLTHALDDLSQIKLRRLVDFIIADDALKNQSPLLTVRLTQFSCGGTALGICWHHSIGDMHAFMCFMRAWSAATNGKQYDLPLVIEDRKAYLQEHIIRNESASPSVRYLTIVEMLRLTLYRLTTARKKSAIRIYFSDSEIENMKQAFSEKTGQRLSKNDVLCAHVFSLITDLDDYNKNRYLSIAIDYRDRLGLPQNILGNMIDFINVSLPQSASSFEAAQATRESVNGFKTDRISVLATHQYIEDNGGAKKIHRFINKGIDPIRRSLMVTNWSKFGVYDVSFLKAKPLYFTAVSDFPFPWLCAITNGLSNQGLIFSAYLPTKLVRKLNQPNNLQKLHQYRDSNETLPVHMKNLS
ncbi:acyltransferase [cf. Phormidesmis sp. LEGE 11477]|uniref:acyltransferase n=1 Tax=cf. Phormidesmis sp. LEGE 11477 TaxID=1828680 RepID=UPI00187E2340|nr:acyltransferase [cf. Phormidesmis sp. LEGE 11477]MBE9063717.1 vinorine synthase [cf. Phormidesmis sp. LEGE 11477]